MPRGKGSGAGDEVRTRDMQLGRLPLCQLSYSRTATHDNRPDSVFLDPGVAIPANAYPSVTRKRSSTDAVATTTIAVQATQP